MPISIRLLMALSPDFAFSLKVRVRLPPRADAAGGERERLRRTLSRGLPPRLVRDVLPD
jgi:hypothetical protein